MFDVILQDKLPQPNENLVVLHVKGSLFQIKRLSSQIKNNSECTPLSYRHPIDIHIYGSEFNGYLRGPMVTY